MVSLLNLTTRVLESPNGATALWLLVCLTVVSQLGTGDAGLLSAWRACRSCGTRLSVLKRFLRNDGFCGRHCQRAEQKYVDSLALVRLQKVYSKLPYTGVRQVLEDREQDSHVNAVIESERRMSQLREQLQLRSEQRRAAAGGSQ